MTPYTDPIISKYFALIKAAVPDGLFKKYFQGDPMRIGKSLIPALIISKSETRVGPLTNAEDEHGIALILTVVTDVRDTVNDSDELVKGTSQLYDIIEGRSDTTYKLKSQSILNILRSNLVVDAALNLRTDLNTITRADYGLTIGKRAPDAYAVEGTVEWVAHFTQVR